MSSIKKFYPQTKIVLTILILPMVFTYDYQCVAKFEMKQDVILN